MARCLWALQRHEAFHRGAALRLRLERHTHLGVKQLRPVRGVLRELAEDHVKRERLAPTDHGANFLALVECKHYKRPVEREKVQALRAKLQAVGARKGIMFSTSGFQAGASEFAEAHGIALVEFVDGRSCYIRRSVDFAGPIPWSQMPPQIPRIVGWLHQGTLRSIVTPDYPDGLRSFLGED